MTELKVVQIRNGSPPLNDIVGKLRELADHIERNETGPFSTVMIVGLYPDQFQPYFACYGDNPDRHTTAGLFMHCAQMALADKEY